MMLSIKIKSKLFILFTILSFILLSELYSSFALNKKKIIRSKNKTPIETDYTEAKLVTYNDDLKINSFRVFMKKDFRKTEDGTQLIYLIAKKSDSILNFQKLIKQFNLNPYIRQISEETISKLKLNHKEIYFEIVLEVDYYKIIPFLNDAIAFDSYDIKTKNHSPFTFVILDIKEKDVDKIQILKETMKQKNELEKEIKYFLKNRNYAFWWNYKLDIKIVTESKRKIIALNNNCSKSILDNMENILDNFQFFGFSVLNLSNPEEKLSFPNPEFQELIDKFSVVNYTIDLNENDLKYETNDFRNNLLDMIKYLSKIFNKNKNIKQYFYENVLPYLDCPLNIGNFIYKEIKDKKLFIYSLKYCTSLLYKQSSTALKTKFKDYNFIRYILSISNDLILNISDEPLLYYLLFAQDRKNDFLLLNTIIGGKYDSYFYLDLNINEVLSLNKLEIKSNSITNVQEFNENHNKNKKMILPSTYINIEEYNNRYKQDLLNLKHVINIIKPHYQIFRFSSLINRLRSNFYNNCEMLFKNLEYEDKKDFEERFKVFVSSAPLM